MENVLERMERIDGKRKIADFMVKEKQPYEFKVRYAKIRAQEFVRECDKRDLSYHVSVGGLDSITLFLFLKSIGIDCPAISVSYLEDKSIQEVHKKLGVERLKPSVKYIDDDGREHRWTKPQIIQEFGFPVLSKEIAAKIETLEKPTEKNQTVRHAIITGETGAYGGFQKNSRMKLSQIWLDKFGGWDEEGAALGYEHPEFSVSSKCCYYLKEKPCDDWAKEHNSVPFLGLMASEGGRRAKSLRLNGCNYFGKSVIRSAPFAIFSRQDLLQLALDLKVPVPEIYGTIERKEDGTLYTTGAQRTGCSMCGFGIHLEKRPHNFFKAQGLTDAGTFGLMANIDAESNFRADNLQNTYEKKLGLTDAEYVAAVDAGTHDFVKDCAGFGLCQWTYWSRKKALLDHVKGLGVSIADTEGQLLFVVTEMTTSYTSLWKLLKTTTSIKEASDAVLTIYERPADMSDKVKERRAEIGMAFYEEHMNGSMGTVELSDDEMTMEEIQHLLAFLGYYKVKVDGLFGNMTREATEKFQERFGGLAVDGLPGKKTQKALRHAVAYGMPERASDAEDNDLIPDAPAPSGEWPGKYWSREEFRCRCGGKYCNGFPAEPDHNLVNILDIVRERGGRPGHRSSGLRCEVWNKMQKGVANSKHKTGKAMDFRLEGHTAAQTLAIVRTVPGVNYCYDIDGTYVHVDVN